jgi:hypothetical protein
VGVRAGARVAIRPGGGDGSWVRLAARTVALATETELAGCGVAIISVASASDGSGNSVRVVKELCYSKKWIGEQRTALDIGIESRARSPGTE